MQGSESESHEDGCEFAIAVATDSDALLGVLTQLRKRVQCHPGARLFVLSSPDPIGGIHYTIGTNSLALVREWWGDTAPSPSFSDEGPYSTEDHDAIEFSKMLLENPDLEW